MNRTRALVPTVSGLVVDLLDLRPCQVHTFDVASGLAMKPRWSGQLPRFYSIAEHCVLISWWLRDQGHDVVTRLDALHHDDDEYLPPDLPAPLKNEDGLEYFHAVQRQIRTACVAAYGLSPALPDIVMDLDIRIRGDEHAQLYPGRDAAVLSGVPADRLGIALQFWMPEEARDRWLLEFDELLMMRHAERAGPGSRA